MWGHQQNRNSYFDKIRQKLYSTAPFSGIIFKHNNLNSVVMKNEKKDKPKLNKAQAGEEIKKGLPEENAMTNTTKNTATQTPGLNQENITRDDLLPSDGDNLTN
jgi:hypothetical protein